MKIIGTGLGRTGTMSLKLALEQLGFGPCYHMEAVFNDLEKRVPQWNDALAGQPDWEKTFEGFDSGVDWPIATIIRGNFVMRDGEITQKGGGKPVKFNETLEPVGV